MKKGGLGEGVKNSNSGGDVWRHIVGWEQVPKRETSGSIFERDLR